MQLTATAQAETVPQTKWQNLAAHVAKPEHPETDRTCTFLIRGLKDATVNGNRECIEADARSVEKVLQQLDVRCEIIDIIRFGKSGSWKQRTALVKVHIPRNQRKILPSAGKLKDFTSEGGAVFISPDYTPDELQIEWNILKKCKKLIYNGTEQKNIKIRSVKLQQLFGNEWKNVSLWLNSSQDESTLVYPWHNFVTNDINTGCITKTGFINLIADQVVSIVG